MVNVGFNVGFKVGVSTIGLGRRLGVGYGG